MWCIGDLDEEYLRRISAASAKVLRALVSICGCGGIAIEGNPQDHTLQMPASVKPTTPAVVRDTLEPTVPGYIMGIWSYWSVATAMADSWELPNHEFGGAATDPHSSVPMTDEWRRWIAENILLGGAPQAMAAAMVNAGFSILEAEREIELANSSPYLLGAERLRNRLAKREWLIDTRRRLERLAPAQIERRWRLGSEEFFRDYYCAGRPVVITGLMQEWPALHKWNLEFLSGLYGEKEVEIQGRRDSNARYELNKARHQSKMRFGDFLSWIGSGVTSNDMYLTAYNDSYNSSALNELMRDIPRIPGYLDPLSAGSGFLWIGPKGTITPLHHDLTNNLLAQVVGRKRFVIASSAEISRVYNHEHCFSAVDMRHLDLHVHPAMADVRLIEFELSPGEAVFLPVGWWHFVESLDFSISVSFTNFLWNNDFMETYPVRTAF